MYRYLHAQLGQVGTQRCLKNKAVLLVRMQTRAPPAALNMAQWKIRLIAGQRSHSNNKSDLF